MINKYIFFIVIALLLCFSFIIFRCTDVTIVKEGITLDDLEIPELAFDNYDINEKFAAIMADEVFKSTCGWKVIFLRPYRISYDSKNSVWIVKGSYSLFTFVFRAMDEPTLVIDKDGKIIAYYCLG